MPETDAFERISNAYYHLTSADKKVADYVIIHQKEIGRASGWERVSACV